MIAGRCHTNLDDFRQCVWPCEFVAVPRLGERVEGRYPDRESLKPRLKVLDVTHCVGPKGDPYIDVELGR